jgi:hypothetical protein
MFIRFPLGHQGYIQAPEILDNCGAAEYGNGRADRAISDVNTCGKPWRSHSSSELTTKEICTSEFKGESVLQH